MEGGRCRPRKLAGVLRVELHRLNGYAEEVEIKIHLAANGDQREVMRGEIEKAKEIVVQFAKEEDATLQQTAQESAKMHFAGIAGIIAAKFTQIEEEARQTKEEIRRQAEKLREIGEGIRKNLPNKEDVASCMREMRKEIEEMPNKHKTQTTTQQFTQSGGAQNTQWGGSSSSSSALGKRPPKEKKQRN
jgi:hypothetical protein